MCVYEVRPPPSLKLDRVDKIERCVEDGRADVEVSEHPCFTAVKKRFGRRGRRRSSSGRHDEHVEFDVRRGPPLSQQWSVPPQRAGCHERRGVALLTWLIGVV